MFSNVSNANLKQEKVRKPMFYWNSKFARRKFLRKLEIVVGAY